MPHIRRQILSSPPNNPPFSSPAIPGQQSVIPGLVPGTMVSASTAIGPRDKPGDDGGGG